MAVLRERWWAVTWEILKVAPKADSWAWTMAARTAEWMVGNLVEQKAALLAKWTVDQLVDKMAETMGIRSVAHLVDLLVLR